MNSPALRYPLGNTSYPIYLSTWRGPTKRHAGENKYGTNGRGGRARV